MRILFLSVFLLNILSHNCFSAAAALPQNDIRRYFRPRDATVKKPHAIIQELIEKQPADTITPRHLSFKDE